MTTLIEEAHDELLNVLRRVVMARDIREAFNAAFEGYEIEGMRIDWVNVNSLLPDEPPYWAYMLDICDVGGYVIAEDIEELETHVEILINKPHIILECLGDDLDEWIKRRDEYLLAEQEDL